MLGDKKPGLLILQCHHNNIRFLTTIGYGHLQSCTVDYVFVDLRLYNLRGRTFGEMLLIKLY